MSKALVGIADWNNESKTRCKSGVLLTFHQRLKAIIQPDVLEAVFTFYKGVWNRIGELVVLTEDRPFLSEACGGFLLPGFRRHQHIQDMLNNTGFLVVSFFHQEGIVLDPFRQRLRCEANRRTSEKENEP